MTPWYFARAGLHDTRRRARGHRDPDCPHLADAAAVESRDEKPDDAGECSHCAGGLDARRLRQERGGEVPT